MLDAALAAELDRASADELLLSARRAADSLHAGRHRSRLLGAGVEFFDHRGYEPGDAPGRIDWRAYGRTDRLLVRRAAQESRREVILSIDRSVSMRFRGLDARDRSPGERRSSDGRGPGPSKFRSAQEIAAALAFVAVRQGDVVKVAGEAPSLTGPVGSERAIRRIAELELSSELAGADAFREAAAIAPASGAIVLVVTDGLDEADRLAAAMAQIRTRLARSALGVVQVLTREELSPPTMSDTRFRDPETGRRSLCADDEISRRAMELIARHINAFRALVHKTGGRHILASPGEPAADVLRRLGAALRA